MENNVLHQQEAFEGIYKIENHTRFNFHLTQDKLTRYLRDRRLQKALNYLKEIFKEDIYRSKVLVICGGVGGEGIFFRKAGFQDVTVSDLSANSLLLAKEFDAGLKTIQLNAEALDLPDESFDLVVVQDGLHHLPRPALGLTEMLRITRNGVVVIEPYNSVVGKFIGTEWESHDGSTNYVYRWDKRMIEQTVKSYLLKNFMAIKVFRFWDHNVVIKKISGFFPHRLKLIIAKIVYAVLKPFNFLGNMMVSVVLKK